MTKNIAELVCGIRFTSSEHWDPHPLVGLSAFCFGVPACAFLTVILCILRVVDAPYSIDALVHLPFYAILCLLYIGAIATSGLADFMYIRCRHRSFYGKIDVIFAAGVFFASNINFALRAGLLETAVLSAIVAVAFMYSGSSKSFDQWVFRHCLWHVVGGGIGCYGALRLPPEGPSISVHILPLFVRIVGAYLALVAAIIVFARFILSREQRTAVWDIGAKHAAWKAVVDCSLEPDGLNSDNAALKT